MFSGMMLALPVFALGQSNLPEVTPSGRINPPFVRTPADEEARTVNIINWDANALPRIFQRSDQLPLTDAEVARLARAGFDSAQLVKMLEERRCACDASAEGLIRLKEQGVPREVISAVSLHALKPNRALNLHVRIDFTGDSNEARENFLYFFLDDGELMRALTANIGDLLSRQHPHESVIDRSDILIARKVRRIELPGEIPLKTYGKHTLLVVASPKPTLTHPSQLTELERGRAQSYTFDYPRSSIQNICRLTAGYKRDAVLTYRWHFMGSRFECEWN